MNGHVYSFWVFLAVRENLCLSAIWFVFYDYQMEVRSILTISCRDFLLLEKGSSYRNLCYRQYASYLLVIRENAMRRLIYSTHDNEFHDTNVNYLQRDFVYKHTLFWLTTHQKLHIFMETVQRRIFIPCCKFAWH